MTFQRWLGNLPYDTPLERRQASLFQMLLLIIIGSGLAGIAFYALTAGSLNELILGVSLYMLVLICVGAGLLLLRRGRFHTAVGLTVVGCILPGGFALFLYGVFEMPGALLSFTLSITLAGLLLRRRGLILTTGLCVLLVSLLVVLEHLAPSMIGFLGARRTTPFAELFTFISVASMQGLFLDRFGSSLREALLASMAREEDLRRLRASLESTVAERTASLQQALHEVEQREAHLTSTLEDLRASQITIRELSAPVLPVLPGVLVAPLIGALDSHRAAVLSDNILSAVERMRMRYVIFDITGVPIVDAQVAQALLQTTAAVRLLGAQVLLVGIRPEVAQTIVALDVDLNLITTYPNLQEAVETLLALNGRFR